MERTDKVVAQVAGIIGEMPEVQDVIEMSGFSFLAGGAGSNLGSMFVMLKPWNQRKGKDHSVEAVMQRVNEKCAAIQEAVTFAINPPAIPGLGLSAGLQMQLLDINSHGAKEMTQVLRNIQEKSQRLSRNSPGAISLRRRGAAIPHRHGQE